MPYYVKVPADAEGPLPDICVHCGVRHCDTERTLSYTKATFLSHISNDLFGKSEEYTLPICAPCLRKINILKTIPSLSIVTAAVLFFLFPQFTEIRPALFILALIAASVGVIGRVWENRKLEVVRMNEKEITFQTSKKWYADKIAEMNNTTVQWLPTYLRLKE